MKLTQASLHNPTAVIVGVLLTFLFGALSLYRLPIQLTPNITQPTISISTSWRAAAPNEMEAEIIEPQEDVLKGLQGINKMISNASQGFGSITLEFRTGTNMERALVDVMNALNQVPSYPSDADEPVLAVGGNSIFTAIAWIGLHPLPNNNNDIAGYQDYVEDVIQAKLERVPGVAQTNAFGGLPTEIRVTFDPYKAAALNLDLPKIASTVGGNIDVSGGFNDVGRRRYTIRFAGGYDTSSFDQLILDWRNGNPVRLQDVAQTTLALADQTGQLSLDGEMAIAINVQAESNVNVIAVDEGIKQAIKELNAGPLKKAQLELIQMYDETIYIKRSMGMVRNNLLLGFVLAVSVLWWFLRKFTATLAVAMAIPISITITFIALDITGRSLNIISMAGLAFAVGMVLDAAIVVLENIIRFRESGVNPQDSAQQGTDQVWAALLASTITTVAIFVPIIFLEDVSGQLFADLAIAIAVAVSASLLIAITVLPTSAARLTQQIHSHDPHDHWWNAITKSIMKLTRTAKYRTFWVVGLICSSLFGSWLLFPQADYLPKGNQNSFNAFILVPPGLSAAAGREELVNVINARIKPHLDGEQQPKLDHTWMGIFGSFGFMGGRAQDAKNIKQIVNILNQQVLSGFPDTIAFAQQTQLFRGLGGGRVIDIDIQSNNEDELLRAAQIAFSALGKALPGAQTRPIPGLSLAEPELRLIPNERRIAEAGWTRKDMSAISRALGTGLFVGDYFDGQKRLNIFVRSEDWHNPEELAAIPLYTPNAGVQLVGELATLERTAGPSTIRRVDRQRTITLQVTPPGNWSLEQSINTIKSEVAPQILANLNENSNVAYRGTAEALTLAISNMSRSFLLALIILYLLMSALFKNFTDSLLVVLTIPLATVGGIASLQLTNLVTGFQPLDLLTMIGFIILLGLVVNNSILLVHQTRQAEGDGLSRPQAVEQAVRLRLRPILMSTLTSIFGMLPLLLIPGAGTELYRGIAAVIIGGMSISTLFTLIFLPSLLQMGAKTAKIKPAK